MDAFFQHPAAEAEASEDLERAFRHADGTAAGADAVVVVEHDCRDAALGEVERQGEADEAGADDYGRVVARLGRRAGVAAGLVGHQVSVAAAVLM